MHRICVASLLVLLVASTALADGEKTASGNPLTPQKLVALYARWFARPYSYMFDRSTTQLTVGQKDYGVFNGGIGGIVRYGSLIDAAAAVLTLPRPAFGHLQPIEKLAGLPIHVKEDTTGKTFSHYNPAIIRWGYSHLIPTPQTQVLGHTCKVYYEKIFSRFFRLMADSYMHLERGKLWDKERDAYVKKMTRKKFDGITYLEQRFAGALKDGLSQDGTNFTAPMAIGFWIRRRADRTAAELWTGLGRLMTAYDATYWRALQKTK